jgi:hypothetical protein
MLRVVVRVTMSADLVSRLVVDILEVTESLMGMYLLNALLPALEFWCNLPSLYYIPALVSCSHTRCHRDRLR